MHHTLLVIGENVEEQISPFEICEVPLYKKYPLTETQKKSVIDYYEKEKGEKFSSFDECYEKYGLGWNRGLYKKDINGNWNVFSNVNPNGKWDWCEIGGRWDGFFLLEDGRKVNSAKKGEIAELGIITFALVKDYQWYEEGETWIFESDQTDWEKKWHEVVDSLPDDEVLTIVDYHSF